MSHDTLMNLSGLGGMVNAKTCGRLGEAEEDEHLVDVPLGVPESPLNCIVQQTLPVELRSWTTMVAWVRVPAL
jgi:hypothetical protein